MSLSTFGGHLTPTSLVRGVPGAKAGDERRDWRPSFERRHQIAVRVLLAALLCGTALGAPLKADAGALLLIGGAIIGVPHGSSDFVVAYRLLSPRVGLAWLPTFLTAYLAAVGIMLLGWALAPAATFLAFLTVSGFHFGAPEDGTTRGDLIQYFARASTPVLPIFLCHPGDVAGLIGIMSGWAPEAVTAALTELRVVGLPVYGAFLCWVTVQAAARPAHRLGETVELLLLAAAAVALPPLLTFAAFFCLIHAVRHMAGLGHARFPRRPGAALGLAAAIVVPSAVACGLALGFAWDALAGMLSTEHLLARALQLTAALTMPHVALEWWAHRDT